MAEKLPAQFTYDGHTYRVDLGFNTISEVERLNPGFSFMEAEVITGFQLFRSILFVTNRDKLRTIEEAGDVIEARFQEAYTAIGEGIKNFTQRVFGTDAEVSLQEG